MLAVEALWLLAQPSGAYTSTSAPSAEPPLALWSALLVKLLAALEASLTGDGAGDAAASSAEPEPAACEPLSGEEVQREVVGAAGPLLLAMLAEALQQLRDAWSAEPGGARAALLRDTVAESDAPAAARQRRLAALLGKAGQGKPRGSEVACGQLLLMVKQLAVLLAELLQLERSACGGPGRDGTVLLTEAGASRQAGCQSHTAWHVQAVLLLALLAAEALHVATHLLCLCLAAVQARRPSGSAACGARSRAACARWRSCCCVAHVPPARRPPHCWSCCWTMHGRQPR